MSKRIMIVDDEMDMLLLIEISLRRRGYNVLKADSPYTALSLLESATPDLFVLDLMMPEMDGLELCRRIRARNETADTPVIMYSAKHDEKTIDLGKAVGANAYVVKGLSQELVNTIQTLLTQ